MEQLAINGGTPTRTTFLPYGRQSIDESDILSVVETLKSDFITTGPKVKEFEEAFSQITNSKYAVAVSNGTAALHIACIAAGIKERDEVITSPLTFAASANCVLYCGGTPVFADINPITLNIDTEDIERKITSKTKAIIPVHYTGEPCDMDKINELSKKYNLIVIEDAAHALGAKYQNRDIGSISTMTCFSLHPVKNITTGEGGVITTNDEILYKKLLMLRSHGIIRSKVYSQQKSWYYEQVDLGYNYRLTDIQCALGLSQLKKIKSFNKRRQEIVDMYDKRLSHIEGIKIKGHLDNVISGNHLYVIQLESEKLSVSRDSIFNALQAENIGVNLHYIPVYLHPYYQSLGYEKGLCPNAEDTYNRLITIPLFPSMSEQDVSDVVSAIQKVISHYLR